jgi:pyruvate dehydrogenase (quinone)
LPDIDYASFAAGIGLGAETVTEPAEMSDAWKRALAADRPYVLDVHCDPNVPPIPPHTTFEQAKALALAVAKGDTDRWGIMKEGLKVKAQQILPHRGRD